MDLTGFDTYIAYSLRGAIAQADINDTTVVGQIQDEESKDETEQQA